MLDTITRTEADLRIREIDAQLAALSQERDALVSVVRYFDIRAGKAPTSSTGAFHPHLSRAKSTRRDRRSFATKGGLRGLIRRIIAERGPLATADIITIVHNAMPDAKKTSIRSTCAGLHAKGEFERVGDKWRGKSSPMG